MTPQSPPMAARCHRLALALSMIAVCTRLPSKPPPASSGATTATTDAKTDAVLPPPFQVSTDKDRGYAAGNTLPGGRADTPLAITPASISVMTKQFLEDFDL